MPPAKNKASHTKLRRKESPDNTDQIKKIEKTIAGIKAEAFHKTSSDNVDAIALRHWHLILMVINIFSSIVTSYMVQLIIKSNATPLSSFGKYVIRGSRYNPLNKGRLLSPLSDKTRTKGK